MTITQFIEKAIEGGWSAETYPDPELATYESYKEWFDGEDVLLRFAALDPEAWKAVGKVEGWPDTSEIAQGLPVPMTTIGWLWNMHRMIDALAEGKSVEEYLETL